MMPPARAPRRMVGKGEYMRTANAIAAATNAEMMSATWTKPSVVSVPYR